MCGKCAANLVNSAARVRRIFAKCAEKVRRIFSIKYFFGGKLLKYYVMSYKLFNVQTLELICRLITNFRWWSITKLQLLQKSLPPLS